MFTNSSVFYSPAALLTPHLGVSDTVRESDEWLQEALLNQFSSKSLHLLCQQRRHYRRAEPDGVIFSLPVSSTWSSRVTVMMPERQTPTGTKTQTKSQEVPTATTCLGRKGRPEERQCDDWGTRGTRLRGFHMRLWKEEIEKKSDTTLRSGFSIGNWKHPTDLNNFKF